MTSMWSTIGEIAGVGVVLVAAAVTPVSDRRKYAAMRSGAREAMHYFAHRGLFSPVPREKERARWWD